MLNRSQLQKLALIRLKEAKVLLDNDLYSGAYYLSGYVIECALKACIAKRTREFDFPDKKTVLDSYSHDLEKLVKTARIEVLLKEHLENEPEFEKNWSCVKDWSEESRYKEYNPEKANDIYLAVNDTNYGVLQWVQQYW
ncbi:MAG: HEPN domain-containing protein [Oscillatoria sp. SIO1A7]|nr:HEPN domain-containing protein [Oscillatoria sp. SIO1A7]